MNQSNKPRDMNEAYGFFTNIVRQARLAWRLYKDRRVPGWVKLIPVAGILYLISPIDLLPGLLLPGLGELDDVAVLLLSLKTFVDLSPPDLVNEHLQNLVGRVRGGHAQPETYIEVPYHIVGEDPGKRE